MKKLTTILVTLLALITLGACVAKPNFETDLFSVVFFTDGGSHITTIRDLRAGDLVPVPEDPIKPGAVFLGWFTDGTLVEEFDFTTFRISQSITIFAKWEYRDFTITYLNLFDGVNDPRNPATFNFYSRTIYLYNATRDNYNFLGWYSDPSFIASSRVSNIPAGTSNDVVLYARWSAPLNP